MRQKRTGFIIGFLFANFVLFGLISTCAQTDSDENGLMRTVYSGTGFGTFEIAIPELELSDPPSITGYVYIEDEWKNIMSDIGFNKGLEDYISEPEEVEENPDDGTNVDPNNTDEYFSADEALEMGLVDGII